MYKYMKMLMIFALILLVVACGSTEKAPPPTPETVEVPVTVEVTRIIEVEKEIEPPRGRADGGAVHQIMQCGAVEEHARLRWSVCGRFAIHFGVVTEKNDGVTQGRVPLETRGEILELGDAPDPAAEIRQVFVVVVIVVGMAQVQEET